MSIEDLPTELLFMILHHLPPRDRLSVRSLSGELRAAVPLAECLRGENMQGRFQNLCKTGRAEVLIFLQGQGLLKNINVRMLDNCALRSACHDGRLEVVMCLRKAFGLGAEDARARNNEALREARAHGRLEVVRCLRESFGLGDEI